MRDEQRAQRDIIPAGVSGVVTVGVATCSRTAGADAVLTAVHETLTRRPMPGVIVKTAGCIGLCSEEVLVKIARPHTPALLYGRVTPDQVPELMTRYFIDRQPVAHRALCQIPANGARVEDIPVIDAVGFFARQQQTTSWRCGHLDPERIDDYVQMGGYRTLDAALKRFPAEILEVIKTARLHGCGGRGTEVSDRWTTAATTQADTKYLVCNALEVDPPSIKDRRLLESDPQMVIEGMVIAAYAIRARIGYLVLNPSYSLARKRLEMALAQARRHRRLGQHIQGTDFNFEILLRRGPATYVTGEETALVSFLAGTAGPRLVPPPMVESGLLGKPTVVANVETFAHLTTLPFDSQAPVPVPTRHCTLDGTAHAGVVEVELGTSLRDLVCEIGGTSPDRIKAVSVGGHLGGLLPPDLLDTPMTHDAMAWLGVWPGTGRITVIDRATCLMDWLRHHLRFAAAESCGQCTPCRDGMEQARRLAERVCDGTGQEDDLALLDQLAAYMKGSSMCGYGQAMPGSITTALRHFGSELREHVTARRCAAGVCHL
ncbi:MAG: hypothetical protein HY710_17065 [Candidatus Latescibacteria bacterium]|nr:hypothetical protein [Candidatus Latescibacterota bacterium]